MSFTQSSGSTSDDVGQEVNETKRISLNPFVMEVSFRQSQAVGSGIAMKPVADVDVLTPGACRYIVQCLPPSIPIIFNVLKPDQSALQAVALSLDTTTRSLQLLT